MQFVAMTIYIANVITYSIEKNSCTIDNIINVLYLPTKVVAFLT